MPKKLQHEGDYPQLCNAITGAELKRLRMAVSLSVHDLAAILGVSRNTLWSWESDTNICQGPPAVAIRLILDTEEHLRMLRLFTLDRGIRNLQGQRAQLLRPGDATQEDFLAEEQVSQ